MAGAQSSFLFQSDPELENALEEAGLGGGSVELNETDEAKWSNDSPQSSLDHAFVTSWLRDQGVPSTIASDLANQLAETLRNAGGKDLWPSAADILSSTDVRETVNWYSEGFYALPGLFGVRNPGGTIDWYTNNPRGGLTFHPDFAGAAWATTSSPIFDPSDIKAILGESRNFGVAPTGGGTTKPKLVLDPAPLAEAAAQMWRGLLLEEPGDVEGIVSEYIKAATSFFAQGGNLDFESFMLEKIRATGKHKIIYGKKPPEFTEAQWIGQYIGSVRALGIAPRNQAALAISGAQFGASEAGFQERVRGTAEFIAGNQGEFSQRFAANLAGMGLRGT